MLPRVPYCVNKNFLVSEDAAEKMQQMVEAQAVKVSPPWGAAVDEEARGGAVPEVARPRAWHDGEAPDGP
jgi:hypothetical protein